MATRHDVFSVYPSFVVWIGFARHFAGVTSLSNQVFSYGNARIGLLNGQAWEAARPTICRSLGHSLSAEETLLGLGRQLNHVYHQVAANLASNQLARVESVEGKTNLYSRHWTNWMNPKVLCASARKSRAGCHVLTYPRYCLRSQPAQISRHSLLILVSETPALMISPSASARCC